MALAACCLRLGACALLPEAWRLQLFSIDHDPWAKLLPAVGHDLELQGNRRQLSWRRVAYFYCEFFHILCTSGCPVTCCQAPSLSTSVTSLA